MNINDNIKKSSRKGKKYMVEIDGKIIHFGSSQHQQYKDRTKLALYKDKDHNDPKRRQNYFKRHSGVNTRREAIEKELILSNGKITPKILSHIYLW